MASDINPATDPKAALDFITSTLEGLRQREGELAVWYQALAEQVTLGVIKCSDVVAYNAAATRNYQVAVDFFAWLRPVAVAVQRATGTALMPQANVPLPQLIGTHYRVFQAGGRLMFDMGVECDAAGNFSANTPRSALQVSPNPIPAVCSDASIDGFSGAAMQLYEPQYLSPYPTITDMRGGGFSGPSPVFGAAAGAIAVGCTTRIGSFVCIALAAAAVVITYLIADALKTSASIITGTRRDEINSHMHDQVIRQNANRAAFITACMKGKLQAVGGRADATTLAQFDAQCRESAKAAFPDREPPYSSGLIAGLTGLALVGGIAAVAVAVARRRKRRYAD